MAAPYITEEPVVTPRERVHTPVRRVTIRGTDIDINDLALDITIRHTSANTFSFAVTIWNLDTRSWADLRVGDHVDIHLGYTNGHDRRAIGGIITHKRPRSRGADMAYTIRGMSRAMLATKQKHSRTWQDARMATIVRDIAADCGLQSGALGEMPRIPGCWAIQRTRPVGYWLDELAQLAARETHTQWRWYARNGTLSFLPRTQPVTTDRDADGQPDGAIHLDRGGTLLELLPASGTATATGGTDEREFRALYDPAVRINHLVTTDVSETRYSVYAYTIRSSSRNGTHHMSGTLVPTDAEYAPLFPGVGR